MKKFITAVFCTTLALSSGFTANAAEAPDRESLETAIWEDLWNGKGDNGLEYPESSYKHHLLDKWLDDNYGTGGYDWTDVGEVTHGYRTLGFAENSIKRLDRLLHELKNIL